MRAMRGTSNQPTIMIESTQVGRSVTLTAQHRRWDVGTHAKGHSKKSSITGILALLTMAACLCVALAALAIAPGAALAGDPSPTPSAVSVVAVVAVVRPILTPATQFGSMPVIYAGAGDGSWPDQMEPNDGADDLLGPAPVEVGTLYSSLNLLPRTQPAPNPTPGEDRDWYVWNVSKGRCYRAFTGDIAGSVEQLTGKWKVQHAIRMWWYPPVREGRKLLAEYNPSMGPAEGGYFAAVHACTDLDGQMAAEVFNYPYPLKNPRGATYTFAALDIGTPAIAPPAPPAQPAAPSNSSGNYGPDPSLATRASLQGPQQPSAPPPRPTAPPPTPTYTRVLPPTLAPAMVVPTAAPASPSPSPSPRPGSPGLPASVDVVAYLDQNQNSAPDPGEGLRNLRVALLDVRTNSVLKIVSTNDNGHARLEWGWAGRVRVSLPDLNWSDLVDPYNMESASRPQSDVWATAGDGGLYLEVRVLPAALPAVIP